MDIKTKIIDDYKGLMLLNAWDEIVSKRFHPDVFRERIKEQQVKYVIAFDNSNERVGVLGFWIDDFVVGGDAIVSCVCVSPFFRKKGISEILHEALKSYCFIEGIKYISYTVHNDNKKMLAAQEKRKPANKYTIFQYEV